jgi:DNA-binding MarR family transcriptional regulator
MEAVDLIHLGRRLGKIGEHALRGGSSAQMTNGQALVLRDVFASPGSSVSAITDRTGLPQSYVSDSIAALCQEGILLTSPDPQDRRRTLSTVSPAHRRRVAARASTPVDTALAKELGEQRAALVLPLLHRLAELLVADRAGPIISTIRDGDQSRTREPS